MTQDTTPHIFTTTTTVIDEDEEVEQEDVAAAEDCTDAPSEKDSLRGIGTVCPKEEIVFLCQVVVLYTVILISIYKLTTGHANSNLWTALLSSSLGYLLPNPTMATDFYLTLPSKASMKVHPDNTLAHYITDLPQRISVSGEWECGLAEIQYPHTWYNVREDGTWFYLNERTPVGLTPSTKIEVGYYRSPNVLLDRVNKALKRIWTDKTRAKLSYSTITQKMTLHMSPGTDFSMPYQSAMGTILGFHPSLVTSPARDRDTCVYTHPRVGDETNITYPPELGLTPSATVTLKPEKTTVDSPYSFRQEANTVVNMNQGFHHLRLHGRRGVSHRRRQSRCCDASRFADVTAPRYPIVSLMFTTCLCCARSSGP